MTITDLRQNYASAMKCPADVIKDILDRIRRAGDRPVWISLADEQATLQRAAHVDLSLPLGGIPFAIKDNFDVAGMVTTAGCPSFGYQAAQTATVVQRLLDAGAILIGKTNMDQFATGLVGTRTPYGACSSVFDSRYISGGSSSGSAVAVAKEYCAFALGTDTAGSGRVPAAFNNLVGLKPTRGLLSCAGVVPACKSLDCVSVFTNTAGDADIVWRVAHSVDTADPFSRVLPRAATTAPWRNPGFRFGVPPSSQLEFFGDAEAVDLYLKTIEKFEAIGGIKTTIDFAPFREAAQLLYSGPWVAERFAAVGDFLQRPGEDVNEVVRGIILNATKYSAADVYRSIYRLEELKKLAAGQWSKMDVMLLPTTGTIYTHEAVEADPLRLNSNLGFYTNFVNLMDLAAVAIPAGFRSNGLPFGVSLIAPAFSDEALLALSASYLEEPALPISDGCVLLAVVGAHLSDQPLNHQLTDRSARMVKSCRTAADYRLFALNGSTPPKPGLIREPGYKGWGIEIEIWAMPEHEFGGFVAAVPQPLTIGNVVLEDGTSVKGFLCESAAVGAATEITRFGSWRSYLRSTG